MCSNFSESKTKNILLLNHFPQGFKWFIGSLILLSQFVLITMRWYLRIPLWCFERWLTLTVNILNIRDWKQHFWSVTYLWTAPVWHRLFLWVETKPWRILEQKHITVCELHPFYMSFSTCSTAVHAGADLSSPLLKSAVWSGLSIKPSPGLSGEMGGEKETVLLLQSRSWSREGSKSGVSSSSIPQPLLRKHTDHIIAQCLRYDTLGRNASL